MRFRDLLTPGAGREQAAAEFYRMLRMAYDHRRFVRQEEPFGEIFVRSTAD